MKRKDADTLRRELRAAIGVYRESIECGPHSQNLDFHRTVLSDAEWTLAKAEGTATDIKPTGHARPTVERALQEVYQEMVVLCFSPRDRGKGRRMSLLAARRQAAGLLGIAYDELKRVAYAR